ncbi:MAG TPA: diheme cytochrome c-553 [Ferruginibacter sp.]|nr:diheme cytochrome c-553 [Ferruginibacter sp.]HRE63194.1 diheme cytochrome c-553 [Ferruginibacter sp.]
MRIKAFIPTTAIFVMVIAYACNLSSAKPGGQQISQDSLIKRGAYLVAISGCNDCHTPKLMTAMGPVLDTSKILSGYRSEVKPNEVSVDAFEKGWVLFNNEQTSLATPGFTSFAPNITSDATGIGAWTYEQFKRAFTQGKWKGQEGSRTLLPPMPWQSYAAMVDEDVQAVFEYLKSTKPVENVAPAPVFAAKNK